MPQLAVGAGFLRTLVKVRDGRPSLEGNPEHPLSKGGLCAWLTASVFSLYNSDRLRHPLIPAIPPLGMCRSTDQTELPIRQSHGKLRLLTPVITSPTSRHVVATFLRQFPDARHLSINLPPYRP
jgi:molybdopterin-containing oxidoreductase family iron-sulfur binding subunit